MPLLKNSVLTSCEYICLDPRYLNQTIVRLHYPMKTSEDIVLNLYIYNYQRDTSQHLTRARAIGLLNQPKRPHI